MEVGDFAAMTVSLEFCGSLELQVDDRSPRVYPLHRDVAGEELLGLRLYKIAPSFRIVAGEDIIVKVNASVYEI